MKRELDRLTFQLRFNRFSYVKIEWKLAGGEGEKKREIAFLRGSSDGHRHFYSALWRLV
jgi:hypothetical protein